MRNDSAEAIGGCLGLLILAPVLIFIEAWWLMLLIGAVHHDVWSNLPAYGFWQTVLIVLAVNAIGGIVRGISSSKDN